MFLPTIEKKLEDYFPECPSDEFRYVNDWVDSGWVGLFNLDLILSYAIEEKASDIHISGNQEVCFTVLGDIVKKTQFPIPDTDTVEDVMIQMLSHQATGNFVKDLEYDCSYKIRKGPYKGRRFRVNLGRSFGNIIFTFRTINDNIPTLEDLGIDEEITDLFQNYTGVVLTCGATGSGKALYKDTKIPTPEGFRKLSELAIGDIIFDKNGKLTEIINKYCPDSKRFFRFWFKDGLYIDSADNHLWEVIQLNKDYKTTVINSEEMFNIGAKNNSNRLNFAIQKTKAVKYPKIELPIEPYWLGAWLGDGCYDRAVITNTDQEMLSRLMEDYKLTEYTTILPKEEKYNEVYRWKFDCLECLKNTNLYKNKHIPEIYLKASIEDKLSLITGLIDTDGTVNKNGPIEIELTNKDIIEKLRIICRSLGWSTTKITSRIPTCYKGGDTTTGSVTYRFKFYPNMEIPLQVTRKLQRHLDRLDKQQDKSVQHTRDYIVKIEEIRGNKEDYFCLEVDSPTHTFLCSEDYIVTHNSTSLASIIRDIQLKQKKKIITVEKPIEYVYPDDGQSLIVQRSIPEDCLSFGDGLTSAMRSAPNIILIGEVRNRTEVDELLRASETGHLSVSTIHTSNNITTLNRIRSLYSGDEQKRIMSTLGDNLRGIVNQTLVRSLDGKSRFAVREILKVDFNIRKLIQEDKLDEIRRLQEDTQSTMEHKLINCVLNRQCSYEDARDKAPDQSYFDYLWDNWKGKPDKTQYNRQFNKDHVSKNLSRDLYDDILEDII